MTGADHYQAAATALYSNGNCLEVASLPDGQVAVLDSKDPGGPVLTFPAAGWKAFIADASVGRFDLPPGS